MGQSRTLVLGSPCPTAPVKLKNNGLLEVNITTELLAVALLKWVNTLLQWEKMWLSGMATETYLVLVGSRGLITLPRCTLLEKIPFPCTRVSVLGGKKGEWPLLTFTTTNSRPT